MNTACMTQPVDGGFLKRIEEAVAFAVQKLVQDETEAAIAAAKKRIEEKIPEIVAGVALAVSKNLSIQTYGTELTIRVALIDKDRK